MDILSQVTTVRGYAEHLGLDPNDRSVIRKIQRQCESGELPAKLEQGGWLIQLPHKNEGVMIMKSWESLKEIVHEGMTLVNAGGFGNDKDYKVRQFYVNRVPREITPNHYAVTWDFNEFLSCEESGSFEWPTPHAVMSLEKERAQQLIDYFSGPAFVAYGRKLMFNEMPLTIVNRPVQFAKIAGTFNYYAGAIDAEGNPYQVYWNMFNVFDPVEIELTVDNSRYCKHCLNKWMPNADTEKCQHEWVQE